MGTIPSVISLLQNLRQHSPLQIDPRPGMTKISTYASGAYGLNVHSLKRMNSGASFIRLAGINANLVELVSNTAYAGFSGNPLSMVPFRPEQSPLPWMYVADSNQMRKISMALENYLMGVATPLGPPNIPTAIPFTIGPPVLHITAVRLPPPSLQVIYDFSLPSAGTDWVIGGIGGTTAAGDLQFTGTIQNIVPDTGSTFPNLASIVQSGSISLITGDTILQFSAFPSVPVICLGTIAHAFASSTISKIVYQSGSTGPCTITMPSSAALLSNSSIVLLGASAEAVQVFGCVKNPDGTFSFQANTIVTHSAGDAIIPQDTVRCFIPQSITAASLVGTTMFAWELGILPTASTGTLTATLTSQRNLLTTNVNGVRPIQTTGSTPDSIFFTIFQGTLGTSISSVKIDLDVDATTNDFAHNFYSFTYSGPFVNGYNDIVVPLTSLVRTGSDTTRTLANVAAIRFSFVTTTTGGFLSIGNFWIGGQYGPYQGVSGLPYQYLVVARSLETGALSNGSPATRPGVTTVPGGQAILIFMGNDPDPQLGIVGGKNVGVYDIYRFGGSLPSFIYVGTMPNPLPGLQSVFFDVSPDTAIASNPQLQTDNFQPFPTIDTPKSGFVNVNGTAVTWVSGDQFNVNWSQGTQILINGILYSFYQQPSDSQHVQLVQVAGQANNVPYAINQATILGVPLPFLWGPFAQGTASFMFAVGDKNQPGVLFLTKGNNPDSAPDVLQIEITSPSEPLVNGCMYDGTSFVFSSDRLFRLYPLFGQTIIVTNGQVSPAEGTNLFTPIEVPNSKGLFAPWGLSVGRKIRFIGRDGIYQTTGGEPELLTGIDWAQLFPHEGHAGSPVTLGPITVQPPDFTQITKLRLSEYDSCLYFDYQDVQGNPHTLVLDDETETWSYDTHTPGVLLHYGEEGESIHSILLGANDGNVYLASAAGALDGNGQPFPVALYSPTMTEGTSRYQTTRNGYLGLQMPGGGNVTIGMQMDQGPSQSVAVPVLAAYDNIFTNMPAMKGRLQSWNLVAPSPITIFMRDAEFGLKPWGDEGPFRPIDPFASFRRPQAQRSS